MPDAVGFYERTGMERVADSFWLARENKPVGVLLKNKSVHVFSGSRIITAISLAGTRVMNRMSVEGTVPGRFANGMRTG
jgi:hypothetical protein